MKTAKRIIALCLSLLLLLPLAGGVAAEDAVTTAVCSKCGLTFNADYVWAQRIDTTYDQTGLITLFLKNSVTREIYSQSPDPTEIVIERYFSNIDYERISTHIYVDNLEFVEEIVSGKFNYELPVLLFLNDKSLSNVISIMSDFGCIVCSDFNLVLSIADEPGYFEEDIIDKPIIYPDGIAFDLLDVTKVLKYIAGWDIELDIRNYDVDHNDKLNLSDVTLILKYIAGWDVELY